MIVASGLTIDGYVLDISPLFEHYH